MKLRNFVFVGVLLLVFAVSVFSFIPDAKATGPYTCTDTDGGEEYFIKGTVTVSASGLGVLYRDSCVTGLELREYYCATPSSGTASQRIVDCSALGNGPLSRCVEHPVTHEAACT